MNILIPHKWLLEHLDTKADPKELQKIVSLSGPSVERIYDREGDSVYDVEITTNRVDSMSVRGFAREAAVILNQQDSQSSLREPQITLEQIKKQISESGTNNLPLPKVNNDPALNNRLMCVVLDSISRAGTPGWIAQRLTQTEMNVHDAAIDITNYVTHEMGHPCHAFDYDKLMATGGEIHIVEAQPDESFTTIDGEIYTTKGGEVVFKDAHGEIIDLPSIKGTKNTSVDSSTKRILLLLDSIKSDKVRFASMSHAIRTTAAQLMEKKLDPNLADDTLALAIKLYQNICGATIGSEILDIGNDANSNQNASLTLELSQVKRYLGIELPQEKVTSILEKLGCTVSDKSSQSNTATASIEVIPPTFRSDLHIPADLIEEIARIYGYHNLPSVLPDTAIPTIYQPGTNFALEHHVKSLLAHTGWQETYTYSMVSEKLATESDIQLSDHLKLNNPLTEDMVYLRRSLLPSLVEMVEKNPTYRPLSIFECACTYEPTNETDSSQSENSLGAVPKQPLHISLVTTAGYAQLKGTIESLLDTLFVTSSEINVVRDEQPAPGFAQSATLYVSQKDSRINLGSIGILKSIDSVQNGTLAAADILWENLLKVAKANPTYQPLPKTSIVSEDITFTVPEQTEVGPIIQAIQNTHAAIQNVTFTGRYKNNVSFRVTYYDEKQNLSSEEVEPIRRQLITEIGKQYQATLVGEV
jgi:phenylalanyl-tRNA synthetase beta chain